MNRGVLVHGVLLLCALLLGYQTLKEDDGPGPELGEISIWSLPPDSIRALTYVDDDKRVRVERREDGDQVYLWGIETREERRRGRDEGRDHTHGHSHDHDHDDHGHDDPHDHGHDHGYDEGHAHDYETDYTDRGGDAEAETEAEAEPRTDTDAEAEAQAEAEDEAGEEAMSIVDEELDEAEDVETVTEKFPVGAEGEELFELYADLKAMRDLGIPDEGQLEGFQFADAKGEITVELADGSTRAIEVGGRVYGGADRYVFEKETGRAFVVRSRVIRGLRGGQSSLRLSELHAFEPGDVRAIALKTGGAELDLLRFDDEDEAHPHGEPGLGDSRWAYADSPDEASQTLANFLGRVESLRPRSYATDVDKAALDHLLALRYLGEDGEVLGELELYRDDAAADGGEAAYYVWSERTRVLGVVSPLAAERVDQDVEQVFAAESTPAPVQEPEGGDEPAPVREPEGGDEPAPVDR